MWIFSCVLEGKKGVSTPKAPVLFKIVQGQKDSSILFGGILSEIPVYPM